MKNLRVREDYFAAFRSNIRNCQARDSNKFCCLLLVDNIAYENSLVHLSFLFPFVAIVSFSLFVLPKIFQKRPVSTYSNVLRPTCAIGFFFFSLLVVVEPHLNLGGFRNIWSIIEKEHECIILQLTMQLPNKQWL